MSPLSLPKLSCPPKHTELNDYIKILGLIDDQERLIVLYNYAFLALEHKYDISQTTKEFFLVV